MGLFSQGSFHRGRSPPLPFPQGCLAARPCPAPLVSTGQLQPWRLAGPAVRTLLGGHHWEASGGTKVPVTSGAEVVDGGLPLGGAAAAWALGAVCPDPSEPAMSPEMQSPFSCSGAHRACLPCHWRYCPHARQTGEHWQQDEAVGSSPMLGPPRSLEYTIWRSSDSHRGQQEKTRPERPCERSRQASTVETGEDAETSLCAMARGYQGP